MTSQGLSFDEQKACFYICNAYYNFTVYWKRIYYVLYNVKKDILIMATVFVIQDIPGSKIGAPKINIIGATEFGNLKVLLPENSQIILSPAYVIQTLRKKLQEYKKEDYLLIKGDTAIIGVACYIVSDITNGKYNLLKWDKQERRYYPVEIDLYKK